MGEKFNSIRFTEKMVNEGLRKALRERDATDSISVFIKHLGQESGSERVYIFEGVGGFAVSNTFEWCAPGISAEKENLQNVSFETVKWLYDTFETQSCVVIKNLEEIKDREPLTYAVLKPQNVHSLIAAPLLWEDKILGFWGVDNPPEHLMENTEEMSEIVAHFLVSLLEKRRLMSQLERLSYRDSLTKVKNRHALAVDMGSYEVFHNVGIIFCDVLGLKEVNDHQGHGEGDKLLIRAIQCLQKVFRRDDIYRVGGDEFVVMCVGIREDLFREKAGTLKTWMQEYEAMMSIGVVWEEETYDLSELMTRADELMYDDKRAYYALHGR